MARKISHTKRGTYYNGPTGRHKVSDPLGSFLFSAAKTISKTSKSSKKRKTSSSKSSYGYELGSNSNESFSSSGCIGLCIVLLLIAIFGGLSLVNALVVLVVIQAIGNMADGNILKDIGHITI